MHIAFVSRYLTVRRGGHERYLKRLIKGLLDRGCKITAFSSDFDADLYKEKRLERVKVRCCRFPQWFRYLSFNRNARRAVEEKKEAFDVIFTTEYVTFGDVYRAGAGLAKAEIDSYGTLSDRLSLKKYLQWEADKKDIYTEDSSLDKLEEAFSEEVLNYYLNFELFERFGVFPVGSSCHLVENLPYYANDLEILNKHHIRRKGVLPRRRDLKARKKRKVMDVIEGERDLPELTPSKESFAKIVESLHTGKPSRAVVAMSNEGQISNLPQDVVVETWAEVSRNGINPVYSGSVPFPFLGYMQLIIGEQEASVEAGIKGGFQRVVEAMALSPMVQNKDCAEELAERMLSEQEDLLPQF